ncbi:LmbE family protein [Caldalkalibacillus thermarum TA2.A1]|uniref:Bacillithiol biosynthesis deacetylase BshB1 n=1 Tax=Caldalkalibacillus thermarum (strain TA2.A1) TaxID=986075 RepID=F5L8W7_CALTT|nr:LmbE family protein [Caldalkalibacillus thermarum TA2.A1]QZT35392.1 bacillithiol biosynthesis deacetylase BshB1 [Caldalkalibacillus thermarum TA2.A1]
MKPARHVYQAARLLNDEQGEESVVEETVDMLCIGAHPDDVEIGMAGTIAKHVARGYKVGIIDLSLAELSSNGTVETRQMEAEQAAQVLGVKQRVNLKFPDRGLTDRETIIGSLVQLIRRWRPQVVFAPYDQDRHPDHNHTAQWIEEAVFTANIGKYQWDEERQAPHQVRQVYYYFINSVAKPDIVVDITDQMEIKKKALHAYRSQFEQAEGRVSTRLNTGFIGAIEGRERLFGSMINVPYAEGFMVKAPLALPQLIWPAETEADRSGS